MAESMRDVIGEGGLLLGGGRAILLQVAHPGVAAGVARHSDFAHRQLDRLRATMIYVYGVTFGTEVQRRRIADAVTRVHRHINGPGYDALDPELQLWVAATLYETGTRLYQRWFGPFPGPVADRIYREYEVLGTALQVPCGRWPADRAAFAEYWTRTLHEVRITDEARAVCRDLLYPASLPLALRPTMPLNRLVTVGLLPPDIRAGYGLSWGPGRQRRLDAFLAATAVLYPRLPRIVRELPKTYYLRELRAQGLPA